MTQAARDPKTRYRPPLGHSTYKVHWIVDFVREERVRQRLPQIALADKVGMSPSAFGQYETGRCSLPALHQLERILAALGYELQIKRKEKADGNATH